MKSKKFVSGSKDKKLLIFLATLILVFLIYQYGISPALETAKEVSLESMILNGQLSSAHEAIAKLSQNKAENKEILNELTDKYKSFFYDINQERLMYYIDGLAAKAGFKITSYNQSRAGLETIPVYPNAAIGLDYPLIRDAAIVNDELKVGDWDGRELQENELGDGGEEGVFDDSLPITHIRLSFSGVNYENVINFLKEIEGADRSIVVEAMNIYRSKNAEGVETTSLEGSISLNVYSLPKLDPQEGTDLQFNPVLPTGKTNPFMDRGSGKAESDE